MIAAESNAAMAAAFSDKAIRLPMRDFDCIVRTCIYSISLLNVSETRARQTAQDKEELLRIKQKRGVHGLDRSELHKQTNPGRYVTQRPGMKVL